MILTGHCVVSINFSNSFDTLDFNSILAAVLFWPYYSVSEGIQSTCIWAIRYLGFGSSNVILFAIICRVMYWHMHAYLTNVPISAS